MSTNTIVSVSVAIMIRIGNLTDLSLQGA